MGEATKNITLNVEGMTCSNCAVGINKHLEQRGLKKVNTNFATGEVSFSLTEEKTLSDIIKSINSLGYKVVKKDDEKTTPTLSIIERKFYLSLFFTIPLLAHMILKFPILHHPIFQLAVCLPIISIGILHFGKSALGGIKSGVANMDVLILIGSLSAFIYSFVGTLLFYGTPKVHDYMFYETAATIISLVLLGNVLEHRSVKQTTTAIKELNDIKPIVAKKLLNDSIVSVKYEDIRKDDILVVNTGDKIPTDGIVVFGAASLNESMITGESLPVFKTLNDKVIGGTILEEGTLKIKAWGIDENTVLAKIIELVKNAQNAKPAIQRLGDKVSSIFVPIVLIISILTFLIAYFLFNISAQQALMNSIAVLVISCPCALGLATPTALMVGIGRAARNGILIKGGNTIEELAKIETIVFDKTGILTTGEFTIKKLEILDNSNVQDVKNILFSMEQHSSHPLAKSIVKLLQTEAKKINISEIHEIKGLGLKGKDDNNNNFILGSYQLAKGFTSDNTHTVYLIINDKLVAFLDLEDTIRDNAKETIKKLKKLNINVILLSGDRKEKCEYLAQKLEIEHIYSEQLPEQKLKIIEKLSKGGRVAMVGDGINDAPALSKATVGISLGNATEIAIQSAQIILLKSSDLSEVLKVLEICKNVFVTIKQNLFWAFFYNVIAIPVAAVGLLNPMIGAFSMAFSDLIVIGNSLRLKYKKIF